MDDLCELTELSKAGCAHCRDLPDLDAEPATTRRRNGDGEGPGPAIPARWPGKCACGEPFAAGDSIRADGNGCWLADCCANLADPTL